MRAFVSVVAVLLAGPGCGQEAAVRRDSRALARAAGGGEGDEVRAHAVPATRVFLDVDELAKGGRKGPWARALARPETVELRAVVLVTDRSPVEARQTERGWAFITDPTDVYGQATPRQALGALVRASRAGRWDVLVRLAPRRYRIGLSQEDLEAAWTRGEHAAALAEARDRLAEHLADEIVADDHEARLSLGDGGLARLEREDGRWVVVDF